MDSSVTKLPDSGSVIIKIVKDMWNLEWLLILFIKK